MQVGVFVYAKEFLAPNRIWWCGISLVHGFHAHSRATTTTAAASSFIPGLAGTVLATPRATLRARRTLQWN